MVVAPTRTLRPRPTVTVERVHAPPARGLGAYCRFHHYPAIAERASDVTCRACLTKMANDSPPPRWDL